MQFLFCIFLLYGYIIAGVENGDMNLSVTCKYIDSTVTCDIHTKVKLYIDEGIRKCIHKIDITSLALNINTPLEEPFSLDILTDNILYLDIHNLQATPVSIAV